MKITYRDLGEYLAMKELEKQHVLKIKYRRNGLKEKKYSLDRATLATYIQGRQLSHNS